MARRAAKTVLAPILTDRTYSYVQALSMARDIRSGALTEAEIALIPRAVEPGDAVLDIGANYGMWVYPLSRAVGRRGRVWAFEPVPFTVSTLRKVTSLLRLQNVEVVAKGCADHAGTVAFDVPVQGNGAISGGQAHIAERDDARPGRERHARWTTTKQIMCEVVAVDDIVPEAAPVSLIKLDIEGAELAALRGCERVIGRCKPLVVCEINAWFLEGLQLAPQDVTSFFFERDYDIFRWADGMLARVDHAKISAGNFVFLDPTTRSLSGLYKRP